MRSVAGVVDPLPESVRDWLTQALQLDEWESFASPTDARVSMEEAFGVENAVVELGALQVFLARYAATDAAAVDPDLAPRLEAMKAFLARYPPRRTTATTPEGDKPEETLETSLETSLPATEPVRAAVAPDPLPESIPVTTTERAISTAEPQPFDEPESGFPTEVADDVMAQPDPIGPIPSYAEERRGATPVVGRHRLRLIAAAVGVVVLIGAIGGVPAVPRRKHAGDGHAIGRHLTVGNRCVR